MNIQKYSTTIYITSIIVLLVVFFNITNLIEQNKETIQKNNFKRFEKAVWENQPENQKQKNTITGLAISEEKSFSQNQYPLSSLIKYYTIILLLVTGIIFIVIMIYKGRKNE